jgi:hypothetical protein
MKTLTGLARRVEFERRGGSWRSAIHANERLPGLAIRYARPHRIAACHRRMPSPHVIAACDRRM